MTKIAKIEIYELAAHLSVVVVAIIGAVFIS